MAYLVGRGAAGAVPKHKWSYADLQHLISSVTDTSLSSTL